MIKCIIPPDLAKKGNMKLYPQDDYFHYTFHFWDGKRITITSLLLKGKLINEVNFKNLPFEKKVTFFPFI
jgi:hypothetical protein